MFKLQYLEQMNGVIQSNSTLHSMHPGKQSVLINADLKNGFSKICVIVLVTMNPLSGRFYAQLVVIFYRDGEIWCFTMKISPGRIDHGMISQRWYDILVAVSRYRQVKGNRLVQCSKLWVQAMITWKFSANRLISLNFDGASKGGVQAGCGGLFQDEHEILLCGFFKYLGRCNTYVAGLWGVYEGLEIARDRGYFRVEYNVDFNIIVDTLSSEGMGSVSSWR